ncbi:c-type cytochrome [Thalassomonas actiniarum]|uniref:cytochrome-c oxidase n=1 Tax=Thalassomonas actiniarum TaxID=485447 RepID=A0AAE9YQK7_9GAMM|nr:c-type cytochrome [Thalassomonas actiniarum]WDD98474.1 c-type cytochrome [Thalassomonas actiniarum]
MLVAIVIIILVVASLVFHFASPWWFTPLASNWSSIDDTINITFWVTGIVFVLVNCFLAYAVFRYRFNKNKRADYEPENKKLETWLTLITTIGVAAMLAPGLFVWGQFVNVPEDADVFEAVGQQWHWSYRLPGKDGILGQTAVELISEKNPFGINPEDANALDDILIFSNEMHVPIDQPVKVLMRSKDVLHNFAVPQFRVKMDLVPGLVSYLWFTPTKLGRYEILCEELCGMAHYTMRGHIVVDSRQSYDLWLAKQTTFAQTLQPPEYDLVKGKTLFAACSACHGSNGEGNEAMNAPQLASQPAWYMKRQLKYYQQGIRGSHKNDQFGQQMAAMSATLADDKAIDDVLAYIATLPEQAAKAGAGGNLAKGKILYRNCSYCHGDNGEGKFALNAPKLTGLQPWYLKRQLSNYQQSIRGAHRKDLYGSQMILMSRLLQNEQAVDDVVAYIGSLAPGGALTSNLPGKGRALQPETASAGE